MLICKTRKELTDCIQANKGKIGFVPTMGALHAGHLSLIKASKEKSDITVCSIFVNPTQFNDPSDFEKYPNTIDTDINLLKQVNCDILFLPDVQEMYGRKNYLTFSFGALENVMEGAFRPGHFNGVATIVSKLFHFVKPDIAFFGQKDLQQFAIINELVEALSFDITLEMCPIIREESGLAMSSRNERMSNDERARAKILSQTLLHTKSIIEKGEEIVDAIEHGKQLAATEKLFEIEYLSVVDQLTLQEIDTIDPSRKTAICIAGALGPVRLIDNIVF